MISPKRVAAEATRLYYWPYTIGPYFKKEKDGDVEWWPLKDLINEVAQVCPDLDQHYALFVWVESEYQRTDGHYDYDLHARKVVMILNPYNYDDHEREVRQFFEEMTSR